MGKRRPSGDGMVRKREDGRWEGRVREHPEHGHELSDTMLLRIHAMLHRCLKDAEGTHVIARNPTDGAAVPKASYKPKQVLTKEQLETFLAAVDRSEIWRDFFYTELTTGRRSGRPCGTMHGASLRRISSPRPRRKSGRT